MQKPLKDEMRVFYAHDITLKKHIVRGFTLIEILVVMLIISIVAGAAVMTLGSHTGKEIEAAAKQFTGLIATAKEQAMLQPVVMGVLIQQDSYEFVQAKQSAQGKLTWEAMKDEVFKQYRLPPGLAIYSSIKEREDGPKINNKREPQIVISTTGDMTPFLLYIGKRGEPRIVIKGEADGFVTQQNLS